MQDEVGENNVFAAAVHMDEKTPHMHLCFTPITKDGRLSAKTLLEKKEAQLDESMARIYTLESTLRQQKRLIDRIPHEVMEQLRTPKAREQER